MTGPSNLAGVRTPPDWRIAVYALLFGDVIPEVEQAEAKFPDQHLPDGTGEWMSRDLADEARARCQSAARSGRVTWADVLREEFLEALAETDPDRLRAELLQVAAVALRWVVDIDGRPS